MTYNKARKGIKYTYQKEVKLSLLQCHDDLQKKFQGIYTKLLEKNKFNKFVVY